VFRVFSDLLSQGQGKFSTRECEVEEEDHWCIMRNVCPSIPVASGNSLSPGALSIAGTLARKSSLPLSIKQKLGHGIITTRLVKAAFLSLQTKCMVMQKKVHIKHGCFLVPGVLVDLGSM
jgi:hypothetical protein